MAIDVSRLPHEPRPSAKPARASQVGGDHYSRLAHQPWDILAERLGPEGFKAYLLGTAVAYLIREKNGLEDLQKARHTLDRLIELEESRAAVVPRP